MPKQDVTVELYYAGGWHSVPVYTRDGISITRGTSPEGGGITPASARLTIDNRTGAYDPSNVFSALYGRVGRNTPLRIRESADVRFVGEVTSWKPLRSIEEVDLVAQRGDAWVLIEAAGQLHRLGQGADVLRSAMTRMLHSTSPLAGWPLELDLTAVTAGTAPGQIVASPVGPAVRQPLQLLTTDVVGTDALVDLSNGTRIDLPVPVHTLVPATGYQLEFMSRWQAAGFTGALSVDALRMNFAATVGNASTERVDVETDNTGEVFTFTTNVASASARDDAVAEGDVYDGATRHIRVRVHQSGADVVTEMWINGVAATSATLAATTLTNLQSVSLNYVGESGTKIPAVGQVSIYLSATVGPGADAATGYLGETAADRFQRFCDEENISCTIIGTAADSKPMGPQTSRALLDQFGEIQRTDDGIVYDTRATLGLTYRTGRSRINQSSVLDLTFPGHIVPLLAPDIDDLGTRNDVEVKSPTSSARAVLATGPMSVLAPPDGVGRTPTSVDVNPETDALALPDLASWYLARGTVPDARYPRVVVDLVATPAIEADVEAVDIGDLITIAGLPAGTAWLQVPGYTETIGSHTRTVKFVTEPEGPYRVGVWGSDAQGSRWGASTSTLAAAVDATATSWLVDPGADVWATTTSHPTLFPAGGGPGVNIDAGGLTYSCTAIGNSADDTFNGRTVASSWGTSSGGQVWTTSGGSAADYAVAGGFGEITGNTINTLRYVTMPIVSTQIDVIINNRYPALGTATGSALTSRLAWGADLANYYEAVISLTTAGTLTLTLSKRVAGVGSTLVAATLVDSYAANQVIWIRLRRSAAGLIRASAWNTNGTGLRTELEATDISITSGAIIAVGNRRETGNTNAAALSRWDSLQVTAPYKFTVARLVRDKSHAVGDPVTVTDTGRYGL